MAMTRSHALAAAVAAAAALTATGITYATAAPAPQSAPAVVQQAPVQAPAPAQAPPAAPAPMGGDVGGNGGNGGRGNEGNERGGNEGNERGGKNFEEGWIHINERSYSARPGGCITVVSGLGSKSLNIRNDSRRTVEVFRGATCDNGAPIATVGPRSSSDGVRTGHVEGGVHVKNGVVGSFRVVERHKGGEY
ncbi:hypothetical protein ACF061_33680 [Streptomyces sp. NPDC015220]|uniref:hypothetical protein n=1 Tax=Streptomyces sp. NPDC015220 TaxID=3364947 RepID=UPI0036F7CC60